MVTATPESTHADVDNGNDTLKQLEEGAVFVISFKINHET